MRSLALSYRRTLAWSLERRKNGAILALGVLVLLALSFVLIRISGGEFMPRMDEGYINVTLELPPGTPLAKTEHAVAEAESILSALPEVESTISSVGGTYRGVNEALIRAKLVDIGNRELSAAEVVDAVRPMLAGIPAAEVAATTLSSEEGQEADLQIEILGEEIGRLRDLADQVKGLLSEVEGVVDIRTSWKQGAPEAAFIPDREEFARRGLSTALVAGLLRTAFAGDDRSVFRESGEEYKVRVQFADEARSRVRTLEEIRIPAGDVLLPLTQLGRIVTSTGKPRIEHRDRLRRITVYANLASGTVTDVVRAVSPRLERMQLPPGYKVSFAGMYEFQEESFASLFQAMALATVLTYAVLAMILESFFLPLTVMVTLPLGLVGASFGLFFGGQTLNIFSLMAMVMLIGIVVNNAILLLDYVAQLRRKGLGLREAVLEGCPTRMRAVIMTNLAIAIGMVPQAIGTGHGFELRLAIAAVTIGGVLISAAFTLILIPPLYTAFEELKERLYRRGK